ncbi:MAG: CerR family C-terminal domain-containing protein, partial [Acetobacteraceae bacterium]
GVNLPAIQYYFGSKEGLYHAVIDRIAAGMEAQVAPLTAEIAAALATNPVSRAELLSLLCRMLDAFVALVTDRTAPDWESRSLFFARAEIESAAALAPLHERVTRRIVEPCAALVGRLIDQPASAEETLLRTVALIGQVIVFCNRKAQRVFGWEKAEPRQIAAIRAVVREHTEAIFAQSLREDQSLREET